MLIGWAGVLGLLLVLAFFADKLNASTWIAMNVAIQALLMVSDVPADGYSVELSQLQSPEKRGQVYEMPRVEPIVQANIMSIAADPSHRPDSPLLVRYTCISSADVFYEWTYYQCSRLSNKLERMLELWPYR